MKIVFTLGALALPAALAAVYFFPEPLEHQGFIFGLLLFLLNMGLVTILVKRFFAGASSEDGKPSTVGFLFIGMIKVSFLGLGLYIALSVLKLSAWFLVGGSVYGLVTASAVFYLKMMGPAPQKVG